MTLFEITTGWTGESYERCYVWAASEDDARLLFAMKIKKPDRELRDIKELFNSDFREFITELSDCGWEWSP